MKEANINLENTNDLNFNTEKSTVYDIEIEKFNIENAYLESEEEIDEKLINYLEREIRNSFEYKTYIGYLKEELDLTKCSLLPGLDTSNGCASLEFHHYPLNLYEITEIISHQMLHSLGENEKLSCFDISERVMEEHFKGNVGLVPLTKTLHEMAHNESIIIPISKVNGNYDRFVKKYNPYIPDNIKDRINYAKMNSESDDAKIYNNTKLSKNITILSVKYMDKDKEDADE